MSRTGPVPAVEFWYAVSLSRLNDRMVSPGCKKTHSVVHPTRPKQPHCNLAYAIGFLVLLRFILHAGSSFRALSHNVVRAWLLHGDGNRVLVYRWHWSPAPPCQQGRVGAWSRGRIGSATNSSAESFGGSGPSLTQSARPSFSPAPPESATGRCIPKHTIAIVADAAQCPEHRGRRCEQVKGGSHSSGPIAVLPIEHREQPADRAHVRPPKEDGGRGAKRAGAVARLQHPGDDRQLRGDETPTGARGCHSRQQEPGA